MNMFEYKGYLGTVEYSAADKCLHGKLAFIRDLVNYESNTVEGLETEFKSAVDDYLESCKALGREPNIPFKGSFNVRTSPKLHRTLAIAAADTSLNAYVCDAIKEKLHRDGFRA